jgi:hypothetical protein
MGTEAHAALLGLTSQPPDITAGFTLVSYDATTDVFTATGFATNLDLDGDAPPDYNITGSNTQFDIIATVNSSGVASAGTLVIQGKVSEVSATSGTLLTGTLSQFGYSTVAGGEIFEFVFAVTGGDLASSFGPSAGVILDANDTGFGGNFTSDFSNNGFGTSDTFPIPEPATVSLLLLGGAGVACRRIRRNRANGPRPSKGQ